MSSDTTKSDFLAGVFRQIEEKDAHIAELERQLETVGALDAKVEASKANRVQALEDTIVGLKRAHESQAGTIAAHETAIAALRDTVQTQRQQIDVQAQTIAAFQDALRLRVS